MKVGTKIDTIRRICLIFAKYGFRSDRDDISSDDSDLYADEISNKGKQLADELERSGPTFIKLGQLLSTRSDFVPEAWIEPLEGLQDDVSSLDFDIIKNAIEHELGKPLEQIFFSIEKKPLASASIGQVHRAVLRECRTEVVVKVRRPGVKQQVQEEMKAVIDAASWIEKISSKAKEFGLERVARQLKKQIVEETDYNTELENQNSLLKIAKDYPNVVVPQVFPEYSGTSVLTMEFIEGTKVTKEIPHSMKASQLAKLAEEFFAFFLRQTLVEGFFHADPHPGNVLLTPDGKLALIDCGLAGHLTSDIQDNLFQLLLALADGQADDVVHISLAMGTTVASYDPLQFKEDISDIVEKSTKSSIRSMDIGKIVLSIVESCGANGVEIPRSLYMLGKMLMHLDGIGNSLDPNFNPVKNVKKNIYSLFRKRMFRQLSWSRGFAEILELKKLLSNAPRKMNGFIELLSGGSVKLDVDVIDEEKLLSGIASIANRITLGLILASMIVGSSLLMHIESDLTIFGYPVLAVIILITALFGGVILAVKILFKS